MVEVRVVATAGLGDRSYVVTDGDVAVVIDPQRDIDRTLDAASDATITHVFETHIHNNYVTGGLALGRSPSNRGRTAAPPGRCARRRPDGSGPSADPPGTR